MTKIGRNDPCSCGSGKKYKKCCEPKEAASRKLTAHKLEGPGMTKQASSISSLFQKISYVPSTRLKEETPHLEEKPQEEVSKEDLEPPAQEPTENP